MTSIKKFGRKNAICVRCKKFGLNFGLNMCSACLRRTKRENRPSFYLGTCYSEMSRRVKTFDPKRPQYFNKKICTKDEFFNRFLNDETFLNLYKNWQNSGYQRSSSPSIDRINNSGDYTIDNLQFLIHTQNSIKDKILKTIIHKDSFLLEFNSAKEAAEFLNTSPSNICKCRKNKRSCYGWNIY